MSAKMDLDIADISLEDIIKQKRTKKGGRESGGDRGGPRRGVQRGAITKPKRNANKWGNDKFFELYKGGGRGSSGDGRSSSGKSICRLSNVPFNISQEELTDLFADYRLSKIALHYDFRGRSLGTAELHGPRDVIAALAREFRSVEIDGRPLGITVVNEGSASSGGSSPRRGGERRRSGPAASGRRTGRVGGGGAKSEPKKKLTAEELDRELDEYMKNKS